MPFKVTDTGLLHPESGRRINNYEQNPIDSSVTAVYTGPHARGVYDAVDGTQYNVSDDWVEMPIEHFGEVSHKLGLEYEDLGHPMHKTRGYMAAHKGETSYDPLVDEFHHICTWHCGSLRRTPEEHVAQFEARLTKLGYGDHVGRDADPENLKPSHDEVVAKITGQYKYHVAMEPKNDGRGGATMVLAGTAATNASLNGISGTGSTNVIPDVSLHTATPSTTGTAENSATSYARQASSWNAASAGAMTNSTSLTFTTGGSVAVTHIGTWSSATYGAGNYAIGAALTSSVTAASIAIASGAITFTSS